MRRLSLDSARIANDMIDASCPAQVVLETVNWRRTPQGQGALAELGAMTLASWRREQPPINRASYQITDIREHRDIRASNSSMQSAPQAPRFIQPANTAFSSNSTHFPAPQTNVFCAATNTPLNQAQTAWVEIPRDNPSISMAAPSAMEFTVDEPRHALIAKSNLQDFSGPPLPSGVSVDSRASGLSQSSSDSNFSRQYPPASLANSLVIRTSGPGFTGSRAAPYAPSPQASDSSAPPVNSIRCRHKPGGIVDAETFVGCPVTDDERFAGNKKAQQRVRTRRSRFTKAAALGKTTGEVERAAQDVRAAAKGFSSRQKAEETARDLRAAAKTFSGREAAEKAQKKARADINGFSNRQDQDDARAALLYGPNATRFDLERIQQRERELAKLEGIDVKEFRRRQM